MWCWAASRVTWTNTISSPHMIIGFRSHLTGRHDSDLGGCSPSQKCEVNRGNSLALDLTRALDNVHHSAILDALSSVGIGPCAFNYISAFLKHRTAELCFGSLSSPPFPLGSRGTPQGVGTLATTVYYHSHSHG